MWHRWIWKSRPVTQDTLDRDIDLLASVQYAALKPLVNSVYQGSGTDQVGCGCRWHTCLSLETNQTNTRDTQEIPVPNQSCENRNHPTSKWPYKGHQIPFIVPGSTDCLASTSLLWMIPQACVIEVLREASLFHPHYDVIKWKHCSRYCPFMRGIQRRPVNSPHKGQWSGALVFSLICACILDYVNNREAGNLRRHRAHYCVIVIDMNGPITIHPLNSS